MGEELHPPRKSVELEDPASTESSDGSDQFVDAQDARPSRSGNASPIPLTRVERVDDEPTYGEVPGTSAYDMRSADAVPDEVEIVPDGLRSRSHSILPSDEHYTTGTQHPAVPKIIAEKIDPDVPAYGDVPGTAAYEMRKADARPDEIVRSPDSATAPPNPWKESPTHSISRSITEPDRTEESVDEAVAQDFDLNGGGDYSAGGSDGDEDGFGEDFDDFEEGQEVGDFEDFGGGFPQEGGSGPAPSTPTVPIPLPSFPILDYGNLDDSNAVKEAIELHLSTLFPSVEAVRPSELQQPSKKIFLSDRSLSLYTQLTAPPPLAPPNWLRSRIRRLFLVSLGVPVDLDEILPASKQKKLILPSVHFSPSDGRSPRGSIDSRGVPANGAVSRFKGRNDSSASVDSKGKIRRRRDEPVEVKLDLSEALRVSGTTDIRLQGMNDTELRDHVKNTEAMVKRAEELLLYWQGRRDGALKEKEAFEGVIENLVRHARKVRK